jgi:hypothetical protein
VLRVTLIDARAREKRIKEYMDEIKEQINKEK